MVSMLSSPTVLIKLSDLYPIRKGMKKDAKEMIVTASLLNTDFKFV